MRENKTMLLGRTTELGYLNNYYDRDGSQILIVYGQKHIGKTALVKEFMKDRPGYYYLCQRLLGERTGLSVGQTAHP